MLDSVTVTGVVGAPPEQVFDLLLDSRNDEQWCPLASDYELVEGTAGVGAVYRFRQWAGPGRRTTMHMRTTAADRPHHLAWDEGGFSGPGYRSTMDLEPVAGGRTRVRHTNSVGSDHPLEQLAWFLGAQVVLRLQLRNLDRLLRTR